MSNDDQKRSPSEQNDKYPTSVEINTGGGDFIGRDNYVHGDEVYGDKVMGNKIIQEAPKQRVSFVLERPSRAAHFQDRKAELDQLLADLQPRHVVTLCGPGGIGKTALAAEAVWQLAPSKEPPERFPDGILFHDFKKAPKADLAFEHIARSFGEELKPTLAAAAQRALAGRLVLLILDSVELADDLPLVLDIRDQACVLVTSRRRQGAVDRLDIVPLLLADAVALLRAFSRERAVDENAVRRISDLVGRLPLALRLVGDYLAATDENATDYLAWLTETPLAALDLGKRSEESIPLLMAQSLTQVSEPARQVLGVVGLLALTPFTHETITAALALSPIEARRVLGELVNYGLLLHPTELYEVTHALIHTYALLKLTPSMDLAVVERLAAYYTTLINENSDKFSCLNQLRPHVMALLRLGSERKAWTSVSELAWAIDNYLDIQGYWTDRVAALEAGLTAARALQDKQSEGACLGNLGNAYLELGQTEQAITYYQQALTISRELGDRRSEETSLGNLGYAYRNVGQTEQAITYYQQALAIAKAIGARQSEGAWLGHLGNAYLELGQTEQAITYYQQALAIAKAIGARRNEGAWLGNLGNAYLELGQVEQAITYYQEALAIAKAIGDRRHEGAWLGNLGNAYRNVGQVEQAITYYQEALAIAKAIGARRSEETSLGNLGYAYRNVGQTEQAITYYQEALAIAKAISARRHEGTWLDHLGNAYLELGRTEQAITCYQQALAIAKAISARRNEGTWLGHLGSAYLELGQTEQAITYYQQALTISRELGDRRGEGSHLGNLGLAYAALGEIEQAIAYHQQALTISREIGNRRGEGADLGNLGLAYRNLGQVEQAIAYHQQALTISREISDRRGEGAHLGNLGLAYAALGEIEPARQSWEQALRIFEEIKAPTAATVRKWLASLEEQ